MADETTIVPEQELKRPRARLGQEPRRKLQLVLILGFVSAVTSSTLLITRASLHTSPQQMVYLWGYAMCEASMMTLALQLAGSRRRVMWTLLPYTFYVSSWIRTYMTITQEAIPDLYLFLEFLDVALYAFIVVLLARYLARAKGAHDDVDQDYNRRTIGEVDPRDLFGRIDSAAGRVIRGLIHRAGEAENTARISLVLMIVLVVIGGGASVGMWVLNDVVPVRDVDLHRQRLASLNGELATLRPQLNVIPLATQGGVDAATRDTLNKIAMRLDSVTRFIRNQYSGSTDYEQAIRRLDARAPTNWAEIANRVTIGVLTLFLVQIFFAVHKYSRQLEASLAGKAEALELISEDAENQQQLRGQMIAVATQALPEFGRQPRTPLQEAASLAKSFGNGK